MRESDKKGFTLIELMVVVAVIGILASIAIPGYLTMVAKAKKAEAKTNLASIYMTETAYYAEFGDYSGDFYQMGWAPTGKNIYEYKVGIGSTACNSGHVVLDCDSINPVITQAQKRCAFTRDTEPRDLATAFSRFVATAEGNIDPGDSSDGWSISEANDLKNDCDEIM